MSDLQGPNLPGDAREKIPKAMAEGAHQQPDRKAEGCRGGEGVSRMRKQETQGSPFSPVLHGVGTGAKGGTRKGQPVDTLERGIGVGDDEQHLGTGPDLGSRRGLDKVQDGYGCFAMSGEFDDTSLGLSSSLTR
ncbi:MAG: hypothetical protein ACO3IN_05940 [Steroidobacteraceae bacterium]